MKFLEFALYFPRFSDVVATLIHLVASIPFVHLPSLGRYSAGTHLMWLSSSLRVRVTSAAAAARSLSRRSSLQLSLQTLTSPSTERPTSRTAPRSCCWQAGDDRVGATTLAQATSCEVASAHCVAAPITLFCVAWSGQVAATLFALSTRAAVVLATALARLSSRSCTSLPYSSSSPMLVSTWCEASPTRLAAFSRFWRGCKAGRRTTQ